MPSDKPRIDVMVSSTTLDLGEHRWRVGEVISRLRFVPRMMDLDATTGKDGIQYSLDIEMQGGLKDWQWLAIVLN